MIDKIKRLEEIKDEILELVEEARDLVQGTSEEDRAESYWVPHIITAVTKDHEWLGGSMVTMEESISSLRHPEEEG